MPQTRNLLVEDLVLDRKNFRIPRQRSPGATAKALIGIDEPAFWVLLESLLSDSYRPIENIIVLHSDSEYLVKEGNRRVTAAKIIVGEISATRAGVPERIRKQINALPAREQRAFERLPCVIYPQSEEATVNRIVAQIHGKGQKAGRVAWPPVARAREARDEQGKAQPALDLLEKFLRKATNVSAHDRAVWSGKFPLSILDEAIKRLAKRIGFDSAQALADAYPSRVKPPSQRTKLETLIRDIGLEVVGFPALRDADTDFVTDRCGFKVVPDDETTEGNGTKKNGKKKKKTTKKTATSTSTGSAHPLNDPLAVKETLRGLTVSGTERAKVAQLRKEAINLNLRSTPLAFCFVLRSMFEISAKAYCKDHHLPTKKDNGHDKPLATILKAVAKHIEKNSGNPDVTRDLHGANAILNNPKSLLSVASMHQLIHNPSFSVAPSDLSVLFQQVFPLLHEMNR